MSTQRSLARARNLPRIALKTAHDVRHLRVCAECGDIGDRRHMIGTPPMHGRCFIACHGLVSLLWMPDEQTNRLQLGDIGPDAMRAVLDVRAGGTIATALAKVDA